MRLPFLAPALAFALLAAGCVAPPGTDAPGAGDVDASTGLLATVPEAISALEATAQVEFGGANDIAFDGDHAFVSTHNNGMHVIDVSDVSAPVEVAVVECNGKDIDATRIGDRVIVTISSQGNDGCPDAAPGGGIRLVDVTNASAPVVLGQVPLAFGSHTHTPYGDTGLVYNSAYDLVNVRGHHRSEIVDISDPANPKKVGEFMFPDSSASQGCHDILAEPERDRAICAGITETMIWDTSDPLKPKVVSTIRNPLINIHHSAATARDGKLLILGDEYGGALAPACNPSGKGPTGAIWFYDIASPASPQMLGHFAPPAGEARTVCTAHNFNTIEGRDAMVAGFYSAGTVLIDFTDPKAPKMLDQKKQAPTSSWASYYYRGAVFSGDGVRGLDVYKLV